MMTYSNSYQPRPLQVRRSFAPVLSDYAAPASHGRQIRYGDRIFVRLMQTHFNRRIIAEFTVTDVNDLSEVYGELRLRTRGHRGLSQLYVRNVTRGWSMEQPFMLYNETIRQTQFATSVTHPATLPDRPGIVAQKRRIPESIQLRYGSH